jgi:hypothetical protein
MHGDTSALSACITAPVLGRRRCKAYSPGTSTTPNPRRARAHLRRSGSFCTSLRYLTKLVQRGEQALDDLT